MNLFFEVCQKLFLRRVYGFVVTAERVPILLFLRIVQLEHTGVARAELPGLHMRTEDLGHAGSAVRLFGVVLLRAEGASSEDNCQRDQRKVSPIYKLHVFLSPPSQSMDPQERDSGLG